MIQPNELRIGNYVNLNLDNEVSQIELNVKLFEYEVCKYRAERLEPIPITQECLKKFGLLNGFYQFFIEANYSGWILRIRIDPNNSMFVKKVKYVHQLQNIYFALTGEELTLKELQGEHSK